ncbi:ArsR family transcriptional regulator [Enterococcus sp. PF1-24]|uniref:ArsR/SmtB family transcription factor n=1 Tax=unclassified Enterococcus TaxID=2608891 RepID=UPI002473CC7B|nr:MULTISPECIES: metalloregulator ArsR/SmtB family transcription factor [unclassified Enterococcus]MDH6365858.1 ArsR family transcriptional regulator [Enterococcus sp. PFB1-1]MDH6402950.1 ArsR family transcriptional regulator [Enterococcus sp. PF1-24]
MNYQQLSTILKALSDPNRLKIVELLSKNSLCACDILVYFDFTQPTLSHHMKILERANIISVEKEGNWHHYSLLPKFSKDFISDIEQLFSISSIKN